mmetsp:Transcript_29954/g.71199  ORF Transcript_29954/g.71199 Transcript_29954/m.71199 type:complete len:331 (-) Transcript_29954:67-1059(-)
MPARAGRQVAVHHRPERRRGARGQALRVGRLHEWRADVRAPRLCDGARGGGGRVLRRGAALRARLLRRRAEVGVVRPVHQRRRLRPARRAHQRRVRARRHRWPGRQGGPVHRTDGPRLRLRPRPVQGVRGHAGRELRARRRGGALPGRRAGDRAGARIADGQAARALRLRARRRLLRDYPSAHDVGRPQHQRLPHAHGQRRASLRRRRRERHGRVPRRALVQGVHAREGGAREEPGARRAPHAAPRPALPTVHAAQAVCRHDAWHAPLRAPCQRPPAHRLLAAPHRLRLLRRRTPPHVGRLRCAVDEERPAHDECVVGSWSELGHRRVVA